MYSKLVFVRKCNPVYEDFCKKYSTVRFYSETIVALANELKITEIEIVYFDETYASDHGKDKETKAQEWFEMAKERNNNNPDYPIMRMYNSAKNKGIKLSVQNISNEILDIENSLIVLSFMTDTEKVLKNQFNNQLDSLIQKSKGFIYLSSDNEYSGFSYKKIGQIGCLEYLGEFGNKDTLNKMKAIIITESNRSRIIETLKDIFKVPVFYMPMIIDNNDIRFTEKIDLDYKKNKVAMLKNLTFFETYDNFFESIRDHGVVWESSMPPIQKKFKPICEKYGFEYKFARFWRMPEFESKLSNYRFFLGMSTVGSSRFTSKILEGTNANTYVISPNIDIRRMGFTEEQYPKCIEILDNSGIGEVYTPDFIDPIMCDKNLGDFCSNLLNISDEEFVNRLIKQRKFILNYFTLESECIQECLNYIIPYLEKVGE